MAGEAERSPTQRIGWGIGLAFAGGLTMIGSVQVLEGGTLTIGTLLEMNLGGGDGLSVEDGGVSLRCEPDWMVGPFTVKSTSQLDPKPSRGGTVEPAKSLDTSVKTVASAIHEQAPNGTILLIGSGDKVRRLELNAGLASGRAEEVAKRLRENLARLTGNGSIRDVLLGNEALAYAEGQDGAGEPPAPQGLARLLYGEAEVSLRSVQPCVLEPRPHRVKVERGSRWDAWAWLTTGLILGALLSWPTLLILLRIRKPATEPAATVQAGGVSTGNADADGPS